MHKRYVQLPKHILEWVIAVMMLKNISTSSFPSTVKDEITSINKVLTLHGNLPQSDFYEVSFNKEILYIPYRIYYQIPDCSEFTKKQNEIIDCYFTRHHNGFIREDKLKRILLSGHSWTVPYVFQLLGEYVYEILEVIYKDLDKLKIDDYLAFINENRTYYQKTRDRMISYWDAYYRRKQGHLKDYVGYKIFNYFESNNR